MVQKLSHAVAIFSMILTRMPALLRTSLLASASAPSEPVLRPANTRHDSASAAQPKKLQALTSLRFLAAALIVLHHSQGSFGIPQDAWAPFVLSQGVSFFFVLSGFILAYVYPSLQVVGKRRFLLARFARIWPAHIVAFALVFVLFPPGYRSLPEGNTAEVALAQLFLVHAWIPLQRFYYSFNDVSWSISTEFGFYLCFLMLIQNWNRTWKIKLVLTALLVGGLAVFANIYSRSNSGPTAGELLVGLMYIHPLARLFEFTLGMTAALVWRRLSREITLGPFVGTILELAVIGLVVSLMYVSRAWAESAKTIMWIGPAGGLWLMREGITCIGFALLVLIMALELGLVARLLSHPWLVLLGEISYSVYLVHKILIRYYAMNVLVLAPLPEWLTYILFWVATLLIAYLIWALVERPCRTFVRNFRLRRPAIATASSDAHRLWLRDFRAPSSRRGILASTVAFLLIAIPIAWATHHRLSAAMVDHTYAEELAARGLKEARQVRFGLQFTLIGADIRPAGRGLRVELVWQSQAAQRLQYYNALQLRDRAGNLVGRVDYIQTQMREEAENGALWRDIITIPPEKLQGATTLALGLFLPPTTVLAVDQNASQDKRWLLLPLPSPVSK
jgi:peptidoglycan/LPS O-acetylase OafA/YrhL